MPSLLFWPLLTWLVAWQSAAVWPAVGLGVLTFILVFSFGFPLAGCAEKAAAASQFSFQDDCPAGWILYGGQCHLVMAASQSWASAAAYCGQQHADLLVLDSPDAAAYFGLLASERGIVRYWTGLQSNVSASWEALNHVPAGYRPWADLAMSVIPHRCPAALPSGVLEGRACTESLPFVCQRRVMWFTLEATCYESSLPTVRPEVWKNDLHFIRFADNDWVIDQASVRSYVDETNTYCVAPVVLRNASLVRSHCNGYDVVATCYSEVVGQCGPAQLDACGWNYPAGGFARVYRSTAAYPEMENFDADAFEQAALQLPLKNQGYARLYVSWVPQLTPYEFADIASREEQCVFSHAAVLHPPPSRATPTDDGADHGPGPLPHSRLGGCPNSRRRHPSQPRQPLLLPATKPSLHQVDVTLDSEDGRVSG
eukprot:GGOE01020623.1.p1 GENE.GGOE01020623.1~~GGOE01020623.1.p1  ORF type:complete len:426 (-),score=53.29 GGOE01020623.1:368-1645(-)